LLLNAFDSEDEEDDEEEDEDEEKKEPIKEWLKRKLLTTRRWIVPLKTTVITQPTANGSATNQVQSPGKKTVVKTSKPQPRREIETAADGAGIKKGMTTGKVMWGDWYLWWMNFFFVGA